MVSLKSSFIRFLGALLVAAGVLMAVTACQERQRASDRAGGTPPDVTQSTPRLPPSLSSQTPLSLLLLTRQNLPSPRPASPLLRLHQSLPVGRRPVDTNGHAQVSSDGRGMAVNRIAYTGSDGNIFTINPDGTDSRRLTTTDLRVGSSEATSWPRA